jgi:hypothetical protein
VTATHEGIDGRRLAGAAVSRGLTLFLSGVPTLVAWSLISKQLSTQAFAGIALAISLPTIMNFILPAFGARIANAAAVSPAALHAAIAASLRANVLMGAILVCISAAVASVSSWNLVLGRGSGDAFPMDVAVTSVSVITALWLVLLVGERLLIALGRTSRRIWASGTTGVFTLLATLVLVWAGDIPSWWYVFPVPVAMVLSALVSLILSTQLPEVDYGWALRLAVRYRSGGASSAGKHLTLSLIATEAALAISIWVVRPILSLRGNSADVAAMSLALQFATPVFSIIAVLGQSIWPHYARHRDSFSSKDVFRHSSMFASISLALALAYVVLMLAAEKVSLLGQHVGLVTLLAMGSYMVARGSWEPVRIAFSSDLAAPRMAAIVGLTSAFALGLMWELGQLSAGVPLAGLALALFANVFLAIRFLSSRRGLQTSALRPWGSKRDVKDEGSLL